MLYSLLMKLKRVFLSTLFVSLLLVTLAQTGLVNAVLANAPVSGPVSRPVSAPVSTPAPAGFSSLSANLNSNDSTFNFYYSGSSANYHVDLSTYADMSWDVYLDFASGVNSPVKITNPKKWDKYQCGKTLYWKVYNSNRTVVSPIQKVTINCASPIPSAFPVPTASTSATPRPTPTPVPVTYNSVAGSAYYRTPRTFSWYKWTYAYYVYTPAANTQIRLVNTQTQAAYQTKTDRWGYFNLRVVSGTYKVNVSDVTNSAFQPNNFTINVNKFIWLFFSAIGGGLG